MALLLLVRDSSEVCMGCCGGWGLGIGDLGLGIGDWGLAVEVGGVG